VENKIKQIMIYKNISQAKKSTGLSYLGMVNNSTKHEKAYKYDELVYTLYLAPAKMSGYEVCPMRTKECTLLCLNESGRNKMDTHKNTINNSRIKKTKLFFEEREFFMKWLVDDITIAKNKAKDLGYHFSVRLNNTSDISPESFYLSIDGVNKNILEIFPDVQFYDYTKVPNRMRLKMKYPNYDLTFSFSGNNMDECFKMLQNNIRVAMVFDKVPTSYKGYEVIDGDQYDMRYRDEPNVIVGLKFKRVRNKLDKKYKFVIQ
jgi:hypothetical protein